MSYWRGVDVSSYQGTIDWKKVKASGVTWAAVKATEGTGYVDPTFQRNFAGATGNQIVTCPYHFARPESHPGTAGGVTEAGYCVAHVGPAARANRLCGQFVLDYESVPDQAFAIGFVNQILKLTGRRPVIYCSGSRVAELATSGILTACGLWVADYGSSYHVYTDGKGFRVVAWQHTSGGTVPGISGRVDLSQVFQSPGAFLLSPPPTYVLDAWDGGGHHLRTVTYGNNRVREFFRVGLPALLKQGKTITLHKRRT